MNAGGRFSKFGTRVSHNLDVPMVLAIILVLLIIVVKLPTSVMDLLLVGNMTLSLVVLLTVLYVVQPLEFSVFPALLLVTTFFRLALNVATTRLILGGSGEGAAGRVVDAFGGFVAGNSVIVGAVIFMIIFCIQFLVITKGASRISEVAARFTLDAMPGKQLSVDADLASGHIDDETARVRREKISREADFFGSMDGASKFIRGDAIAGVIITLVNILGGFAIGWLDHGMSAAQAVEVYTRLTIGDGLVSQIPALVVSIAAGLLVTRSTAESDLGKDFFGQLLGNPKAMFVTAGFLVFLLPSGLPPVVLVAGASVCAGLGYVLMRIREEAAVADRSSEQRLVPRESGESPSSRARSLLSVEALELEIGYGLVGLVDPSQRDNLLHRIGLIRERIAIELGFVVPPIRIRDNLKLDPNRYVIKLRGAPVGDFQLVSNHFLAVKPLAPGEEIEGGRPTSEPSFGMGALWIPEAQRTRAESLSYTIVDSVDIVAGHLAEVIRTHAAELLTREEVNKLIEGVRTKAPALVEETVPDVIKTGEIQKVLQHLLRERVGVRDLEAVLEAVAAHAPRTKDPEILTEYVRQALARPICQGLVEEGKLHVITLDPALEDYLNSAIEHGERGSFLTLSPEVLGSIVKKVMREVEALVVEGRSPSVLCAPQIRLHVRRMLESELPGVSVLSYDEIVTEVEVVMHGTLSLEGETAR